MDRIDDFYTEKRNALKKKYLFFKSARLHTLYATAILGIVILFISVPLSFAYFLGWAMHVWTQINGITEDMYLRERRRLETRIHQERLSVLLGGKKDGPFSARD